MKALIKLKPLCEEAFSNLLFWLWPLPQPGVAFGLALMKRSGLWIVLASKEAFAGLVALMMATTANHRIYVGLVLMFVIAPLSYCWYVLFDRAHHIHGWYHVNYFHLFFLIRFQIAFSVFVLGLYHYLPQDRRTKLLAIPLGFLLMSIALNVLASSNDDIWRVADMQLFGAGICLSLVVFFGLDYFVWRKFHGQDSFDKRLDNIAQVAYDLPAEKVVSMFVTTVQGRKEFKAKA